MSAKNIILYPITVLHLHCSFDDIWEPSEKDNPEVNFDSYDKDPVKIDITKEAVPPALLMKVTTNNRIQDIVDI